MASQAKMADSVASTTGVMTKMNKQLDPAKMAVDMRNFEQANMKMEMSEELSWSFCDFFGVNFGLLKLLHMTFFFTWMGIKICEILVKNNFLCNEI